MMKENRDDWEGGEGGEGRGEGWRENNENRR